MMHILLVNTNPVVSRLFALCMRESGFELEEAEAFQNLGRASYDIVFVDEASYTEEARALLLGIQAGERVLLSKSLELTPEAKAFDRLVKKPFLPSQITEVVEKYASIEKEMDEEEESLQAFFPLSSGEESEEKEMPQPEPAVLDLGEIDRIKALLEMENDDIAEHPVNEEEIEHRKVEVIKQQLIADGLEIVDEDEIVEVLSRSVKPKKEKSRKKKNKKLSKGKKDKKSAAGFEEELLAAVMHMKVKKIKKLLQGAEVTLKIKFKDKV